MKRENKEKEKNKESETTEKYLNLETLWRMKMTVMKMTVIPIVDRMHITGTQCLQKGVEELEILPPKS